MPESEARGDSRRAHYKVYMQSIKLSKNIGFLHCEYFFYSDQKYKGHFRILTSEYYYFVGTKKVEQMSGGKVCFSSLLTLSCIVVTEEFKLVSLRAVCMCPSSCPF